MNDFPHTSVLLRELIDSMRVQTGSIAIDCTVGAGGHTEKLLDEVGKSGKVIGIDRDDSALAIAKERLGRQLKDGHLELVKAPFSHVAKVASSLGVSGQVDAICADIGVSSMHLDLAERGFSFQKDGPLDMRMDQASGDSAADIVNQKSESELADIFYHFGEEPKARVVARKLVAARAEAPIKTTLQLADIVKKALPYAQKSKKHPATKVFQALRIAVNDELGQLEALIDGAMDVLKPGGRLAIISFHSLEDRMVKNAFLALTAKRERSHIPKDLPLRDEQIQRLLNIRATVIKPFPLVPSAEELSRNPRARSAKLRVLEKTSMLNTEKLS